MQSQMLPVITNFRRAYCDSCPSVVNYVTCILVFVLKDPVSFPLDICLAMALSVIASWNYAGIVRSRKKAMNLKIIKWPSWFES